MFNIENKTEIIIMDNLNNNYKIIISMLFSISYYAILCAYVNFTPNIDFKSVSYFSFGSILLVISQLIFNRVKITSIFYIFILTYIIFVFGRFFSVVFSDLLSLPMRVDNLKSLFSLLFMVNYQPTYEKITTIFLLTNGFVLFLFIGFLLSSTLYDKSEEINNNDIFDIAILKWAFYILFIFNFIKILNMIWLTYQQGYMALYASQSTGSFSIGTVHILFMVVFGLVTYKKSDYKSFLILFVIYSLLCGLTGARGGLVTGLLTSIYVYSKHNKVDVFKLIVMLVSTVLFMVLIFNLSSRAETSSLSSHGFIEKIIDFLYIQGNTLSIIGYSISGKVDYPPQAIYQAFLPLAFRIYILFHSNVEFYTANISAVTAYTANPEQYLAGYGLGSSIVSETYNIFAKTITTSLFISFFLGFFMGKAEAISKYNIIYWAALLSIIPNILFLSRSGYNDIFPALIYAVVFLYIIRFLFLLKNVIKKE
jgi:hypothetical protein